MRGSGDQDHGRRPSQLVGDAGVHIPTADPEDMARAIVSLLGYPGREGRVGMARYRRTQERFTLEKTARETVALYREALHDYR